MQNNNLKTCSIMKKSTLFIACCIGLLLLASCKKTPKAPTIDIYDGVGCVAENALVYSGEEILVGFMATGDGLTQIEIVLSQNGTVLASHSGNFNNQKNDPVPPYIYTHAFTVEASGTVNIKGTVTDVSGQTVSKSFNVIYNEKPNAKFVGQYNGIALTTGTIKVNISGMEPMEQELTDREVPVVLVLREGENMNEVVGTCTIEGREIACRGTVEGDTVTFEATEEAITFEYNMGGFTVSPELNVTYSIRGTLTGRKLVLDGSCSGNGNFAFNSGTVEMNLSIGGSLDKN